MEFQVEEWRIQLKGDRSSMKSQISLKSMMNVVREEGQRVLVKLNVVTI